MEHKDYSFVTPHTILYTEDYKKERPSKIAYLEEENRESRVLRYTNNAPFYDISTGVFRTEVLNNMYKQDNEVFFKRYSEDCVFIQKYLVAGRGKVLTSTHLHKLNNGATRNAKSFLKDVYGIEYINYDFFFETIGKSFSDSILNDKFYELYMTKSERISLARKIRNRANHKKLWFRRTGWKIKLKITLNYLKIMFSD